MMRVPTLPIDPQSREIAEFFVKFRTIEGFVAVFEQKLTDLRILSKRRDIKRAAYYATEQLYAQLYNEGESRFRDSESFFHARRNHLKRKKGES
jgi:hypothetical protein